MRTKYDGSVDGTFTSLPFGDALATASGSDNDAYHFAMLDHGYLTNTDHAWFRQYANAQGRWTSPDPYAGSYDATNPQSLNRYAYVLNAPLSFIDPTGLMTCPLCSGPVGGGDGGNGGGSGAGGSGGGDQGCGFSPASVPVGTSLFFPEALRARPECGSNGPSGGGGGNGNNNQAQNNTTQPQQPQHFWQKPGCGSAIAEAVIGMTATAGEAVVIVYAGPALLEMGADAIVEDGLIGGGMDAGHILTGAAAMLTAAPLLAGEGLAGAFTNCR
jgi:RHS repeat-associated protein